MQPVDRAGPGTPEINIEARLRRLEFRYRTLLSATVAAKANYLALAGEPNAKTHAIGRAKSRWQGLAAHKRAIAALMGELEELEQAATP